MRFDQMTADQLDGEPDKHHDVHHDEEHIIQYEVIVKDSRPLEVRPKNLVCMYVYIIYIYIYIYI